jgi:hypothetical protein
MKRHSSVYGHNLMPAPVALTGYPTRAAAATRLRGLYAEAARGVRDRFPIYCIE